MREKHTGKWQQNYSKKTHSSSIRYALHTLHPRVRIAHGADDLRIRVEFNQFFHESTCWRISSCCITIEAFSNDARNYGRISLMLNVTITTLPRFLSA